MGEVHQFPNGASNREALKAVMAEQEKRACARILGVAHEEAVQRFNSCPPLRARGRAEENATNRNITSYSRVWLLRKVLKMAEEQDRQETRIFLGLS